MASLRILALAVVLLLSPETAWAEIKDFGLFTLNVPSDWTANQDSGGVYIAANDGSSVISIIGSTLEEGITLADVARGLAQKLQATAPHDRGGGEAFSFTYSDATSGNLAVSLLTSAGKSFMYINQIGANDEGDNIIRSMKFKPDN